MNYKRSFSIGSSKTQAWKWLKFRRVMRPVYEKMERERGFFREDKQLGSVYSDLNSILGEMYI